MVEESKFVEAEKTSEMQQQPSSQPVSS